MILPKSATISMGLTLARFTDNITSFSFPIFHFSLRGLMLF
jgi:hypothetical protein